MPYLVAALLAVLLVGAVTGICYLWDTKRDRKKQKGTGGKQSLKAAVNGGLPLHSGKNEHFLKGIEQKNTFHIAARKRPSAQENQGQGYNLEIWNVQEGVIIWRGVLKDILLIGRGERQGMGEGLSLNCPEVSKNHCMLKNHGSCLVVEDLQSKNHTYLNHELVTKTAKVENGDLLCLGTVELQVFFTCS